ncbi:MAG: DUF5518 domain-containing protein, partial [Methanobacterium sp.]
PIIIASVVAIVLGNILSVSGIHLHAYGLIILLIASIYVGYSVGGDYINGAAHGALFGIVSAAITGLAILILGIFIGIPMFGIESIPFGIFMGIFAFVFESIIGFFIGVIGGVMGALIKGSRAKKETTENKNL